MTIGNREKEANFRNSPCRFFERKPEKKKEHQFNQLVILNILFDINTDTYIKLFYTPTMPLREQVLFNLPLQPIIRPFAAD